MLKPCLKSKVYENQNPFMWSKKECSGAKFMASNTIGDWSSSDCIKADDCERAPFTAIVIVEPRQMRLTTFGSNGAIPTPTTSSTSTNHPPEWFMLPQAVDVNNDVMRLVSSLSTVVQILTRMTNAAAQELRQHPEREEGFQGLRLLLNYADQMYTTLLQPQPISPSEQLPSPSRQVSAQPHSLFHHLFDPMLGTQDRPGQELTSRQLLATERPTSRMFPFRVVAVAASAAGMLGAAAPGSEATGPITPAEEGRL